MASLVPQLMTLVNLPSDIIRNIFPLIHTDSLSYESITAQNARLISLRWNALGVEHLIKMRHKFPVIKRFCWHVDSSLKSTVSMCISEKYKGYFGVEKWNFKKLALEKEWYLLNNTPIEYIMDVDFKFKFKRNSSFEERKRNLHERISRLVTIQCSKSKKIELHMNANLARSEIISIENVMSGITINQLHFIGIRDLRVKMAFILEVLKRVNVRYLVLVISDPETIENGSFFTDALRSVLTIEITSAKNNATSVSDNAVNQIWQDKTDWLKSTVPLQATLLQTPTRIIVKR